MLDGLAFHDVPEGMLHLCDNIPEGLHPFDDYFELTSGLDIFLKIKVVLMATSMAKLGCPG